MTLQLPDCALWRSHCKTALIWSLCECVGNRTAFPVLWEKTLQRKMAGNLQGLLIRPMKVSQSTWERWVLRMSGTPLRQINGTISGYCTMATSLNNLRWCFLLFFFTKISANLLAKSYSLPKLCSFAFWSKQAGGMFLQSFGCISRIHQVKSPQKALVKGRQNLKAEWAIRPSITIKWTNQICCCCLKAPC